MSKHGVSWVCFPSKSRQKGRSQQPMSKCRVKWQGLTTIIWDHEGTYPGRPSSRSTTTKPTRVTAHLLWRHYYQPFPEVISSSDISSTVISVQNYWVCIRNRRAGQDGRSTKTSRVRIWTRHHHTRNKVQTLRVVSVTENVHLNSWSGDWSSVSFPSLISHCTLHRNREWYY